MKDNPCLESVFFGNSLQKLAVHLFKREHEVHLLAIGFELEDSEGDHKCKCLDVCGHIALEFCPDLNVNDRLFQPLRLGTHINDKQ